jgi:hypothetical protein
VIVIVAAVVAVMIRAVVNFVAFLNVAVLWWAFVWVVVFHHPWIAERPEDKGTMIGNYSLAEGASRFRRPEFSATPL